MELRLSPLFLGAAVAVAAAQDAAAAARAGPPQCPSAGTHAVSFAQAIDGVTFRADDAGEVRLIGVLAPGAAGELLAARNAEAAREALTAILQSGSLTLAANPKPDRYGRTLAHIFAGGIWVQGELLRRGLVRASSEFAAGTCAKALLQAENEGREKRAGHWGDGMFAVLTPEQLKGRAGTFQIVEARVVSASVNKGRAYINFGADYRTDFTVTVSPLDMRTFRRAKFEMKDVSGKRIRVRGWVDFYNGPEMEIATPAAIEVLD